MSEYPASFPSPTPSPAGFDGPPVRRRPRIWTVFLGFVLAMAAHIATAVTIGQVAVVLSLGVGGYQDLVRQTREYEKQKGVDVEVEVEGGIPVVDEDPAVDDPEDEGADAAHGGEDAPATTGDDEAAAEAETPRERSPYERWMISFAKTPLGFAVVVLPGQLAFLAVTLLLAFASPERWRERLALRRPDGHWIEWIMYALATPSAALIVTIPLSQFVDQKDSQNLADMQEIFSSGGPLFFLLTVLGVALLPAVAEEALFRGYVQSRLLKAIPAWGAILLSGVLFAVAHLDPIQSLGVLPIGLWIGVVAFRTQSLYPAIACHLVNNAYALVAMRMSLAFEGQDPENIDLTQWEIWVSAALILSSMFFFAVSGLYLLATGLLGQLFASPPSPPEPETPGGDKPPLPPPADPAGVEFLSDVRPYRMPPTADDDAPYAIPVEDDPPQGIDFEPPRSGDADAR